MCTSEKLKDCFAKVTQKAEQLLLQQENFKGLHAPGAGQEPAPSANVLDFVDLMQHVILQNLLSRWHLVRRHVQSV